MYRNDPKFSDRYTWANSADPDQEQSVQGLHCLLPAAFWVHYSLIKPSCSNFRVITANFCGV